MESAFWLVAGELCLDRLEHCLGAAHRGLGVGAAQAGSRRRRRRRLSEITEMEIKSNSQVDPPIKWDLPRIQVSRARCFSISPRRRPRRELCSVAHRCTPLAVPGHRDNGLDFCAAPRRASVAEIAQSFTSVSAPSNSRRRRARLSVALAARQPSPSTVLSACDADGLRL